MAPPGLAMVSVSDAAWTGARERNRPAVLPRLGRHARGRRRASTRRSRRPVSIVVGLNVALGMILERGLEAAFEHHVRLGRACREGIKAMGLELFSPDDDTSAVVTTVRVPEPVDGTQFLLDLRDRFGITLAPGPGPAQGQGLPHRAHRLLRRLRHHDGARRDRALRWRRRVPTSSAASPSPARSRRTSTCQREPPGFSSGSRSPRPGSSCFASASTSTWTRTATSPRRSADYDAIVIRSATQARRGPDRDEPTG